ncbi:MAG TPA: ATP-binding cassette domain-containing protein, partial [Thermoanaerobaculia bacterium]|nr:ATP-binding cassette domain-containing protein [Thermoanaerobaculia bacterium]
MIRPEPATASALLEIEGLEVAFPARGSASVDGGWVTAVRGVSLTLQRGEMLGLVGESGSGKSLTALALLGLVPPPARVRGHVWLEGEDVLALPGRALRRVRGGRIAIVFQEPMTAFNPVYSIGFQIAEAVRAHRRMSRRQALDEAARLLDLVAVPDARRRLGDYPHQLSGG